MILNPSAESQEFDDQDTTVEIVFRSYGCEEDLKPEELTEAFGQVGHLILSPWTPPRAGSLYDLSIILKFAGKTLAGELLKVGGRKIYERLRDGYRALIEVPKLRDAYLRPNLTIQYDNIVLVLIAPSKADFAALPELFEMATVHLNVAPLSAWDVHSILFDIERNTISGWSYDPYPLPERTQAGLGRYWGLVASLGGTPPPERYTHVYDSIERTIVELGENHLGSPPKPR